MRSPLEGGYSKEHSEGKIISSPLLLWPRRCSLEPLNGLKVPEYLNGSKLPAPISQLKAPSHPKASWGALSDMKGYEGSHPPDPASVAHHGEEVVMGGVLPGSLGVTPSPPRTPQGTSKTVRADSLKSNRRGTAKGQDP